MEFIGDKIRKTLMLLDLKIIEANGQLKLANEEFEFNQRFKQSANQKKAIEAKVRVECYKVFINNLIEAKKDILKNLDTVLSVYEEKDRKIWIMHFIQHKSVNQMAEELQFSTSAVYKIIAKFKEEFSHNDREI